MVTDFELHHQTLLHFLLVSLAFLTYLLVPDDIVWAFVKDSSHPHLLERSLFAVATLLIGAAAAICTWARAYPAPQRVSSSAPIACDGPYGHLRFPSHLGNLLFAAGLGSLVPLPGFLILVAGQALLDFRLIRRAEQDLKRAAHPQ
jgi:protein-S-isoprenylcysteine O-methyltransferase Ste14